MTNSGQDVHSLIGEVIIAHRDQIDSPYLNLIHALRVMMTADSFVTDQIEMHVHYVYEHAIKMLTAESDFTDEKSTASVRALDALAHRIKGVWELEDPWAARGDDDA